MSAAPKLRLGLPEYADEHPTRICIYNGNYGPSGNKHGDTPFRWFIKRGRNVLHPGGFPSHEDATDWLRAQLVCHAQVTE